MAAASDTSSGGRIGGRIAGLVGETMVSTRQRMAAFQRAQVAGHLDDFFDKVSGEIRHTTGPLFAPLADHPDMPADMKPLFQFMARGSGQWQTFLGQAIVGNVLGTGLGSLLDNILGPAVQALIASQPHSVLDPSTAAKAFTTGFTHGMDMDYEARKSGVPSTAFQVLTDLAYTRADVGTIIDALNKGTIDEATATVLFTRLGYNSFDAAMVLNSRHAIIDAARLADLVTFGVLSEDAAKPMAAKAGMQAADFDLLVQGNGQPPSIQELLFAYRRGVIDKTRLLRGVMQGPLRNEWFDVVESFGQVPMSTADAIQASIQGNLSQAQARQIATANGLIPEQFDPLWNTAGTPPGIQEMLHLLNRNIATEAQVRQSITESRIKNKYVDLILQSRFELPTQAQILSMLRKGIITEARGRELLGWRGYQPDIVNALILDVAHESTTTAKTLSLTAIRELLLDKAITDAQALERIQGLGYSPSDAALELELITQQRTQRYVGAVVTRIHREYVTGLLAEAEARDALNQLLLPADQITTYMDLWVIERSTVRRTLTEAQVASAYKKGLIESTEALQRWSTMGYSDADTAILLALATPATATPPPPGGTGG
jgi:hypothetical protein